MAHSTRLLLPYTYENHEEIRIYSSGHGVYLCLKDGKEVLDGLSGSMNANLGHGNTVIAAAMQEQARGLTSLPTIAGDASEVSIALADKLCCILGVPDSACVFTSSGSEATEAALAIVWKYWSDIGRPEKSKILSLDQSYHGCTLGALTLTGRVEEHANIAPPSPSWRLALPAWDPQDATCVSGALEKVLVSVGSESIAAIFLEPVMGLAGIIPAAREDIRKVVEICRANDILVVLDEALTGLGRSGSLTAAEYYGIEHDLILLSKGLGCGFTSIASTCIASHVAAVLQSATPTLRHGHTSSGNPLAARIALAVLDELSAHDAIGNANRMGTLLKLNLAAELSELSRDYSLRAIGLCLAIETEDSMHAQAARRKAFELGLRVRAIDNNIIVCPPLIISEAETAQLVALLSRALADTEHGKTVKKD